MNFFSLSNEATRKFKITYMVHAIFVLDSASTGHTNVCTMIQ